ncbi:unnamed protein product [Urochloa humidicola]
MDLLPEELLVDILRRLPPRPITMCRNVSKHLRAVIDSQGLLLRGLRGIFVNYKGQDEPYFFSRPERHEATEPRPMPEWELKHKADIKPSFLQHYT